ncbi:hypothetical protein [Deinococcus yunweiensis]|uniref:hypothetical protein n=1 Tax=Deinococcus yunweiensis TaxID=367282 RepID=UPI00398F15C4
MSLTSYFRDSPEARNRVTAALARPLTRPVSVPLRAEPRSKRYGLVGTAFDYLLRSLLVRTHTEQQLLHTGSPCLALLSTPDFIGRPEQLAALRDAHATRVAFEAGAPLTPEVARACLVLASFDVVLRVGGYHHLAGEVQHEDAEDLLDLAAAVPLEAFQAQERLLLNPLFPAGGRVFGADADLVVDDLLIDVKTTLKLSLRGEYVQQLCGYLALERLSGLVGGGDAPIRRVGLYFARHGVLHVWPVKTLFQPGALPKLVSWLDDNWPSVESTMQRTAQRRMVGVRHPQDDPWRIVRGLTPLPADDLPLSVWHRRALEREVVPPPIRSVLVARSAARALLGHQVTDDDAHLVAGLLGACPAALAPLTFLQDCLADVARARCVLEASRYVNVWYQTRTGGLDKRCRALLIRIQASLAAPLSAEDAAVLDRLLPVAAPLAAHLEPTRAARASVRRLLARGLLLQDGQNVQRLDEASCCPMPGLGSTLDQAHSGASLALTGPIP